MKGQFEFDAAKSPTFSLGELKRLKQRALAEPGAAQQFQELAKLIAPVLINRKADAVLLTGIMLSELAMAVMKEREVSQLN